MKKRMLKKRNIVLIIILVVVVAFLTWLGITVALMDVNLGLHSDYKLPEFVKIEGLPDYSYGDNAVAIDGTAVGGKNFGADTVATRPTASTAKMILALAVMREKPFSVGEVGENIIIDQEMYNTYNYYLAHNGSNVRVQPGETLSEYDALAGVMLASANNLADSLAVWAFGSMDGYREYATKMLNEWGIVNTTVGIDASGFDASTTSTAEDLARIGAKVMEQPVLAEIVALKNYNMPVVGLINNTNKLLGQSRISGVKTGFIGDASGYCLITGYKEGENVVTTALLGAPSRESSFTDSLNIVNKMQELVKEVPVVKTGDVVGYYDSWWTGRINIFADSDLNIVGWDGAKTQTDLVMSGDKGELAIVVNDKEYKVEVSAEEYNAEPSFGEKLSHAFGWSNDYAGKRLEQPEEASEAAAEEVSEEVEEVEEINDTNITTGAPSTNCTIKYGALMLINPNFMVDESFIAGRKTELVSLAQNYGIREGVAGNGDNLLDAEAATHINEMVKAYAADNPGHTLETRSCFRSVGTKCGRLCAAIGASDHHTGLTCDLIDPVYGTSLDTDTYNAHVEWQWLKANSYKYGFIDRFPEAWAGGPMSEPLNVDENGSTGLFETWHYRYVGVKNATEIATGKYNNGQYDSLEHYLKARGLVSDLKAGKCD